VELNCSVNLLAKLNVNNCWKLNYIGCPNNQLTQIIYPPNPKKITHLDINNNNLSPSDLTIFRQMRNLEYLDIGNTDKNKIDQGIYNRWVGSCEPLKGLNKLERLDIRNTDIDSG